MPLHVSNNIVLIFRKTIVLTQHLVLSFFWATVQYTGYEGPLVTCTLKHHLKSVTIPDAVLIQLSF